MSTTKAHLRSVDISMSDSDGEEVASCVIKPKSGTFECTITVPQASYDRVLKLLPDNAERTKTEGESSEFVFALRVETQFAAAELFESLFRRKHRAHIMHVYETWNGPRCDPFTILEDDHGSTSLTVLPGYNREGPVQLAYLAALRASDLCEHAQPLRFGDVDVTLTAQAAEQREATFLALADLFVQVKAGG
ncbi:MAG TPA: hypothetical protein VJM32_06050 [Candidatus Saccharimonadales bacterium]|nr:hypothetical protein [Candidatus Saccharimonadales bacterium]